MDACQFQQGWSFTRIARRSTSEDPCRARHGMFETAVKAALQTPYQVGARMGYGELVFGATSSRWCQGGLRTLIGGHPGAKRQSWAGRLPACH